MAKLSIHYIWFKIALIMGLVLGLYLLVHSVQTYHRASVGTVAWQMGREATGQLMALPREAFNPATDPVKLKSLLDESRQEASGKIAWLRILDKDGAVVATAGTPEGQPIKLVAVPKNAPEEMHRRFRDGVMPPLMPERRKTKDGEVSVHLMELSRPRFGPTGPQGFGGTAQGAGGPNAAGTGATAGAGVDRMPDWGRGFIVADGNFRRGDRPVGDGAQRAGGTGSRTEGLAQQQNQVASNGAAIRNGSAKAVEQQPDRGLPQRVSFGQMFPRRYFEVAVYTSSASAELVDLLRDLIISSSAALGLVASMILLYFRLPNYVNGKRLEQQTELARQVQMDLLPPARFTVGHLDFAAECVPAWQVGGDFYDVFAADDERVAIVLGDVSGKGLPASVVVGLLLGAVRASNWMAGGQEHEASTTRLSELIRTRTAPERFASLFWGYYDPDSYTLYYINGGHPAPMLVRHSAGGETDVQYLEEGGAVLGVVAGAPYQQGQVNIRPGDLLVVFSDGVIEATNSKGEQFDDERLEAVVKENVERTPVEIRAAILKSVHEFLGELSAQDDLTLIVARFIENA
jgi:serine phosphatase RsbU (regulator of sigma subunit)